MALGFFFTFGSSLLLSLISVSHLLLLAILLQCKAGGIFAPKALILILLTVRVYYMLFFSSLLLEMCVAIILFLN